MSVVRTGVFATPEQLAGLTAQRRAIAEMPLVHLTPTYAGLIDKMENDLKTSIDTAAVLAGLPSPKEIDGEVNHYGLLATGEFTRWVP